MMTEKQIKKAFFRGDNHFGAGHGNCPRAKSRGPFVPGMEKSDGGNLHLNVPWKHPSRARHHPAFLRVSVFTPNAEMS
jgi:hypothetical protein